jgi:hypothetical protein
MRDPQTAWATQEAREALLVLEATASALRMALLEMSAPPPAALARLAQQLAGVTDSLQAWHQHLNARRAPAVASSGGVHA